MAWITLTAEGVKTRLTGPEYNALTGAARAQGQTPEDVLDKAIAVITTKVRGRVAACKRNKLGPADTVPDEVEDDALALIRNYLFTRFPGLETLNTVTRQKETDVANGNLVDAAKCLIAIVPPEEPAPENQQAGGAGAQLISPGRRRYTRHTMRGL